MPGKFLRPVTMGSVGMGALYFFASHMVIRSMFYVGVGRNTAEVAAFFCTLVASVVVVHLFPGPFLRLRVVTSSYIKVPVVSLLATVGALFELMAILPDMGPVPFYVGAALIGLSCGWLVVIWMSSFHTAAPEPLTFVVSPDLLCAVGFYFLFRIAGSISPGVSDGLLLALPLISIACMLLEKPDDAESPSDERVENRRASLVLVCVSAFFALTSALVVHISGKEGSYLSGGVNYMVFFEVLVVCTIVGCCYLLHWFAAQRARVRHGRIFVAGLLCLPTLCIGLAMGTAYRFESIANLMWETSFWVMLIAVLAYDLRYTLYLVEGLAVGLMFEAMCIGQITMQLAVRVGQGPGVAVAAVALAVLYSVGVLRQLLAGGRLRTAAAGKAKSDAGVLDMQDGCGMRGHVEMGWAGGIVSNGLGDAGRTTGDAAGGPDAGDVPDEALGGLSADAVAANCANLGKEFCLTPSETRILVLVARGRSARYIAEELGVSFNTVRTHIRHVYEKLAIHSRQELIDLVERSEL